MLAEVIHPETGEKFSIDIPSISADDLDHLAKEYTKDEEIKSYIEKLPVAAEVKAILFKLSKFSISVGNTLIRFGKRVLEIVMMLVSKYKNATFGLIIGAMLTVLIAMIPWIGAALSSFLGPLLMLLGFTKGLWEDLKKDEPQLASSIGEAGSIFRPLNPEPSI